MLPTVEELRQVRRGLPIQDDSKPVIYKGMGKGNRKAARRRWAKILRVKNPLRMKTGTLSGQAEQLAAALERKRLAGEQVLWLENSTREERTVSVSRLGVATLLAVGLGGARL